MDYTNSANYATHTATGKRMHEDNQALPTVVSDVDLNGVIWEMLNLITASGQVPKAFNPDDVASYTQILKAVRFFAFGSTSATAPPYFTKDEADARFYFVRKELGNTEHLDDIKTPGDYTQRQDADTATARGYPIARAGLLEVRSWGDAGAIIHRYTTVMRQQFIRVLYGGVWSIWHRTIDDQDIKAYSKKGEAILNTPTDFNTLTLDGVFWNPGNTSHTNCPDGGFSGVLIVRNPGVELGASTSVVAHTYFSGSTGRIFFRLYYPLTNLWTDWAGFFLPYQGTSINNATFPVGTQLLVVDPSYTTRYRNAQCALYLSTANSYQFTTASGGTALTGTWACRGGSAAVSVFERVA